MTHVRRAAVKQSDACISLAHTVVRPDIPGRVVLYGTRILNDFATSATVVSYRLCDYIRQGYEYTRAAISEMRDRDRPTS